MKKDNKPYNSVTAAKYLLALAISKRKILNVTKTQKLLYIAYGYFLSKKNRVLLDEKPRAWPYGPVFPKTREGVDYSESEDLDSNEFSEIKEDTEVKNFFEEVLIEQYAKFTAYELSQWSHREGGPWYKTVEENNYRWNKKIPDKYISDYFLKFTFDEE